MNQERSPQLKEGAQKRQENFGTTIKVFKEKHESHKSTKAKIIWFENSNIGFCMNRRTFGSEPQKNSTRATKEVGANRNKLLKNFDVQFRIKKELLDWFVAVAART